MTEAFRKEAQADAAVTVPAPIDTVLVMEDRAQVTRRAKTSLSAGRQALRIADCSPLVADRTLRCRLRAAAVPKASSVPPRILDVQVRRHYLVKPARPEKEREITNEIERKLAEYLAEYDRAQTFAHELGLMRSAYEDLAQHIRDRLYIAPFDPAWKAEIEEAWSKRAEIEERLVELGWSQEDRALMLRRLEQERRLSLQPLPEYRAEIITEVFAAVAAEAVLEWEYQVPCALWRPEYTAEIHEEQKPQVRWQSAGSVWQATGEDWPAVELRFSTARPTLGAELPLLADDVIETRPKTDEEKKVVEVSSREEVIATTATVPEKSSDTPPGLDDGGEARTFLVPQRVDVPSDGRPHRIEFESFTTPAESELACVPERQLFVFLRSLQTNPSAMPLLAGPVSLIRNGGFCGRSQIGYVAPKERFALSWGSEDGLVVLRDVIREHEEVGLRKQQLHKFQIDLYLGNQSAIERKLSITERLPLSEVEQVEVAVDEKETSRGFVKDAQGLLTWEVTLPAGAEQKLRLSFGVKMPHNVRWSG